MTTTIREQACTAIAVPAGLAGEVAGYQWIRDQVGESGGEVYRLHGKPDAPDLYLKTGKDAMAGAIGMGIANGIVNDIAGEMIRLRWLARYLPVPEVRHFVGTGDQSWLLMTALPGKTAYQVLQENPSAGPLVVDALVQFLQRLHAIPINACPFNTNHEYRLAHARIRLDAGLVDAGDFDEEREGWTAEQVWEAIEDLLPFPPDPVVTHGDFSLDNLLMIDGRIVGCIDAGRVGIADRYQDLAILWNCLGEFGAALQQRLFVRYGITSPDQRKLQFHLLLDELF